MVEIPFSLCLPFYSSFDSCLISGYLAGALTIKSLSSLRGVFEVISGVGWGSADFFCSILSEAR